MDVRSIVRSVGAGLLVVSAVAVAGACGSDDEPAGTQVTAVSSAGAPTAAAAEGPVDPWTLPVDQRPPLFDPCTEIPADVLAQFSEGGEQDEKMARNEPGNIFSCSWDTSEASLDLVASWKSRAELESERVMNFMLGQAPASSRSQKAVPVGSESDHDCREVFFTERGTIMLGVRIFNSLRSYRGRSFVNSCDALDSKVGQVESYLPWGDFR